jgi:ABC-type Fe3+/spermidine/putrescine transport system ATPase subunit
MNWLDGQIADISGDAVRVQVGPGVYLTCTARGDVKAGQKVRVAVRPEAIKFAARPGESTSVLPVTIAEVAYLGQNLKAKLSLNGHASLSALVPKGDQALLRENAPAQIQVEHRDLIVFPQG